MLVNELLALEMHKNRVQETEKVEGNRALAEIIAEFKAQKNNRQPRKNRR